MSLEAVKRWLQGKCIFCEKPLPKGPVGKIYCWQCSKMHKDEIKQMEKQAHKALGF